MSTQHVYRTRLTVFGWGSVSEPSGTMLVSPVVVYEGPAA